MAFFCSYSPPLSYHPLEPPLFVSLLTKLSVEIHLDQRDHWFFSSSFNPCIPHYLYLPSVISSHPNSQTSFSQIFFSLPPRSSSKGRMVSPPKGWKVVSFCIFSFFSLSLFSKTKIFRYYIDYFTLLSFVLSGEGNPWQSLERNNEYH